MPMVYRLFYIFQLSSTCLCLLDIVICFICSCRRCTVDVTSNLEGTSVNPADREQVVDDVIMVTDVTSV